MNRTFKILLVVVFAFFICMVLIFNTVLAFKVSKFNKLVSFAQEVNSNILDDTLVSFSMDFNLIRIVKLFSKIEVMEKDISQELMKYNNIKVLEIKSLMAEITEIVKQADDLGIEINKDTLIDIKKLDKMVVFNKNLFNYVLLTNNRVKNYKKYLAGQFDLFRQSRQNEGKFANNLWGKSNKDLEDIVSQMKVADKAGQLLAFSIDGVDLSSREIDRYRKLNPGNIILIGPNIKGETQVKKLTNQLQSINSLIPLFVSIDQEGGAVKRIPWDSTSGQKNWENMTESDLCNEAKQRSSLLLKLGINMNYAPVVDLTHFDNAFINNRTISIDPKIVSSVAKAYINCSQETGIINTLKHYPGHGSTTLDSHDSLPVVSKSDWLDSDAVPFRENLQTKQIMVAHLIYEKIDPENSTSCSKIFITDILRNKWKYAGLIITDDMNMLHDSTGISVKEALVKVFNAGNDMAIYVATLKKNEEVKSELVSLINSEKIPMHRVDESLMRILKAKRNLFY